MSTIVPKSLLRVALVLIFGALFFVKSAPPALSQQSAVTLPSPDQVQALARRVNDYWIANHTGPDDFNWSRATYFSGNMAHYQMSGDERYLDTAWQWAEEVTHWQINGGCFTVFAEYHTPGLTYLPLYHIDPQRADLDCLIQSIDQSMSWGWLEVDLGAPQNINRILLDPIEDRAYRYLVDAKSNETDPYQMVLDRSDARIGESEIVSTTARFVRVRVIGAAGYSGPRVTLGEFQLFGEADPDTNLALNQAVTCSSEPEPENSCANAVDGNVDSFWSAIMPDEFTIASPNWWWVDALYVAAPVYAELSLLENDGTVNDGTVVDKLGYASVLYAKYNEAKVESAFYDVTDALWYRDFRFLTQRSPNDRKIYWSRGNGWAIAAHVRLLQTLPTTDPHYQEYLETFQAMAAAIIARQESVGYWNQNLDDPNHCGGPESSGTAFFVYALAWGINNGHLHRATYLPATVNGWNWLANTAVQNVPDGLLGYVQPIGDAPICDATTPLPGPTDSADFGVGAFLLAASEVVHLSTSGTFNSMLHLPQITR